MYLNADFKQCIFLIYIFPLSSNAASICQGVT